METAISQWTGGNAPSWDSGMGVPALKAFQQA
jgi:hypothetical protein